MFIYCHIYDTIEKFIMSDLFGLGSQAQKWILDFLVLQLEQIENKQESTLEAVTPLRNDLDLHTRMKRVEDQMQRLNNINHSIPAP